MYLRLYGTSNWMGTLEVYKVQLYRQITSVELSVCMCGEVLTNSVGAPYIVASLTLNGTLPRNPLSPNVAKLHSSGKTGH